MHCIEDLCGHLRISKNDADRLFRTPGAMGGLGMHGGWAPAISDGLALDTPDVVPGLARETKAGSWDDWTESAKRPVRLAMHTWFPDSEPMRTAAARSLASGVMMGKVDKKECVKEVELPDFTRERFEKWSSEKAPQCTVDPMFSEELIKTLIRANRVEEVCLWFPLHERMRIEMRRKRWHRRVWLDWLLGRLRPTIGRRWGDAPDMTPWIASQLEDTLGITPTRPVDCRVLMARKILVELKSARVFMEIRTEMGG